MTLRSRLRALESATDGLDYWPVFFTGETVSAMTGDCPEVVGVRPFDDLSDRPKIIWRNDGESLPALRLRAARELEILTTQGSLMRWAESVCVGDDYAKQRPV